MIESNMTEIDDEWQFNDKINTIWCSIKIVSLFNKDSYYVCYPTNGSSKYSFQEAMQNAQNVEIFVSCATCAGFTGGDIGVYTIFDSIFHCFEKY